jgi:hypothetical protein
MNLSPVAIAIQGVAQGPLLMAVQGLLPVASSIAPNPAAPLLQLGSMPGSLGGGLTPKSVAPSRRRTSGKWHQITGKDWFENWLEKVKKSTPIPVAIESVALRADSMPAIRSKAARESEMILFL